MLMIIFIILMLFSYASRATNQIKQICQALNTSELIRKKIPHSSQIIIVQSLGGIKANVTLCQRQRFAWKPAFKSFLNAVIGKNGIALSQVKKEGDLKTPAGLYPIGKAFGTHPLALRMDYKYITVDDKFIDDVNDKFYNSWVSGSTDAKSYELMRTRSYAYGAVINYNMNPTIPGKGSAIFIHLWRSQDSPTAGCIALDKRNLLRILHWFDKSQHPYILLR